MEKNKMKSQSACFAAVGMLLLGALLTGCNLPERVDATQSVSAVHTAAAQTVAVELTHIASTGNQTPPPLIFPDSPTATTQPILPGSTPVITPTGLPCDRASFVVDVTYPDDSTVTAGTTFIKIWRLKNNGSCPWTAGYTLVFVRGDALGASVPAAITDGTVAPGETVDIAITLTAPAELKTYQGYFQLRNPTGSNFGTGASGTGDFWYKVVTIPAATP